jgi:CRP-like cAMP-binding protein
MIMLPMLPKPALDPILPLLRAFEPTQGYPPGAELYPQGVDSSSVFVLKSGIAQLQWTDDHGQTVLLALRTGGSMMGASATLSSIPYVVSAIALTRCQAWRLSSQVFRELVRKDQIFSWYHHQLQAHDTLTALRRVTAMSYLSAAQRLELFLDEISESLLSPETQNQGKVPLRDQDLAHLIGITPTYLSRLVKRLIAEGRLRRDRGVLVVNQQMASAR